ncbi:MAG: serine/threonine protein kinase, partial [Planctomycetota bacterium]
MNRLLLIVALILGCCARQGHAEEGNWPAFRGPAARGVALGKGLPDRWSATENVAWKTDIAGRGWSSPVVWGDKIFL